MNGLKTVLSVDMDFFVDGIALLRDDQERLGDDYHSWPVDEILEFLKSRCQWSPESPCRGAAITHHDEAFDLLRSEIELGRLKKPFRLVHIDAHSDLGMGDTSYAFILGEVLRRPVNDRTHNLRRGEFSSGLSFGNWLAFCIAARWISEIQFVKHPDWDRGTFIEDMLGDLPRAYFQEESARSGIIQMRPSQYTEDELRDTMMYRSGYGLEETSNEPVVPFTVLIQLA